MSDTIFSPIFCYALIVVLILGVVFAKFKWLHRSVAFTVYNKAMNYTPVTYVNTPLTPASWRRLQLVKRKTLVLDMDETMITSLSQSPFRARRPLPNVAYDYSFYLKKNDSTFYIYKRPHLDLFLDHVSNWYDLVVFTAALEPYAAPVLDFLDAGRSILMRRFFRPDCIYSEGFRCKNLMSIHDDPANVLLLDNSRLECICNIENSINIKSYRIGSKDDHLLRLLPFLDALRFVHDVRSVLSRGHRYRRRNKIKRALRMWTCKGWLQNFHE